MLMTKDDEKNNEMQTQRLFVCFFFQLLSKNVALLIKALVDLTIKLMRPDEMNRNGVNKINKS